MGVWGTDLFSDDLACDIRDHYRELLENGIEDGAATRLILEKFGAYLEESEGIALLAFAITQSKLGRLDPDIRDRALVVLEGGADLEVWERENPKLLPEAPRRARESPHTADRSSTASETPAPAETHQLGSRCWRRSRPRASTARGTVAGRAHSLASAW